MIVNIPAGTPGLGGATDTDVIAWCQKFANSHGDPRTPGLMPGLDESADIHAQLAGAASVEVACLLLAFQRVATEATRLSGLLTAAEARHTKLAERVGQ